MRKSEHGVGNTCGVCLYKNVISRTFKVMKTSGKSIFFTCKTLSFPFATEKRKIICFRTFLWPLKGFIDEGVPCTRVFTVCLPNELRPYSTEEKIMLALPLQLSWASVVRKWDVNSGWIGPLWRQCSNEEKRNHPDRGLLPAWESFHHCYNSLKAN